MRRSLPLSAVCFVTALQLLSGCWRSEPRRPTRPIDATLQAFTTNNHIMDREKAMIAAVLQLPSQRMGFGWEGVNPTKPRDGLRVYVVDAWRMEDTCHEPTADPDQCALAMSVRHGCAAIDGWVIACDAQFLILCWALAVFHTGEKWGGDWNAFFDEISQALKMTSMALSEQVVTSLVSGAPVFALLDESEQPLLTLSGFLSFILWHELSHIADFRNGVSARDLTIAGERRADEFAIERFQAAIGGVMKEKDPLARDVALTIVSSAPFILAYLDRWTASIVASHHAHEGGDDELMTHLYASSCDPDHPTIWSRLHSIRTMPFGSFLAPDMVTRMDEMDREATTFCREYAERRQSTHRSPE
jgi:hypothetical protein